MIHMLITHSFCFVFVFLCGGMRTGCRAFCEEGLNRSCDPGESSFNNSLHQIGDIVALWISFFL